MSLSAKFVSLPPSLMKTSVAVRVSIVMVCPIRCIPVPWSKPSNPCETEMESWLSPSTNIE